MLVLFDVVLVLENFGFCVIGELLIWLCEDSDLFVYDFVLEVNDVVFDIDVVVLEGVIVVVLEGVVENDVFNWLIVELGMSL